MRGNVLIIGLGLIGGSIALAIKKEHPDAFIQGYDIDEQQAMLAKALKIIDEPVKDYKAAAAASDLIMICTPVNAAVQVIEALANVPLKERVILTDAGSTKKKVMEAAERHLGSRHVFIGGHPMAGSHKSGVTAAKERLFENAFYMLTPSKCAGVKEIGQLKMWLRGTKAKFLEVSAEEHDYLTGVISHLPHIMAASMVNFAEDAEKEHEVIARLAAGGFRDTTRIASSSPEMWKDILLHNGEILVPLLDSWIREMGEIKEWMVNKDGQKIYDFFHGAKRFRDAMPVHEKGAIPSSYDLYVDVPDYPGVISEITGYLAESSISITNIRILETREEIYGVLAISFQSNEDRVLAVECLQQKTTYDTYFD